MMEARSVSKVLPTRLRTKSSEIWVNAESIAFDVISGAMAEVSSGTLSPGGGGSAIPCGLVLPAASAKLELADLLPEVIPAALSY